MSEFQEMLFHLRMQLEYSQKAMAVMFNVSSSYYHDLERGNRKPSVDIINVICDVLERGPKGRLAWHRAGAKAHGWEI